MDHGILYQAFQSVRPSQIFSAHTPIPGLWAILSTENRRLALLSHTMVRRVFGGLIGRPLDLCQPVRCSTYHWLRRFNRCFPPRG